MIVYDVSFYGWDGYISFGVFSTRKKAREVRKKIVNLRNSKKIADLRLKKPNDKLIYYLIKNMADNGLDNGAYFIERKDGSHQQRFLPAIEINKREIDTEIFL